MNRSDLSVGQKVMVKENNPYRHRPRPWRDGEIVKLGRKYVTIRWVVPSDGKPYSPLDGRVREGEFAIDTGIEKGAVNYGDRFLTPEEQKAEERRLRLEAELRRSPLAFRNYNSRAVSNDALADILDACEKHGLIKPETKEAARPE